MCTLPVMLGIEENPRRVAHFSELSCGSVGPQRPSFAKKDVRMRSA
jgi:hypothetical protein